MTDADLDCWRLVHRCALCARETPYELVEAWEIGSGTAYCRHCGQYGPLHSGNPDHVAIVIHNYRWRQNLAAGDPKYDDLENQLAKGPVITVPTITFKGDDNGARQPCMVVRLRERKDPRRKDGEDVESDR